MRNSAFIPILTALATLLPAALAAQPKLQVVGDATFSLGTVYRGDIVQRNVQLKNSGSDTLVIGNVEVSCGCTGTAVARDHIPPGGTGNLLIKFNSSNFTGEIHKSVTINSNAAGTPRTLIQFTGTVVDEILIDPAQFWFRDAEVGRVDTMGITIKNNGRDTLRLKGFHTRLDSVMVRLPGTPLKPGESVRIIASFIPKKETPVLVEQVYVETSNPRRPDLAIPVYGNVKVFKFQ